MVNIVELLLFLFSFFHFNYLDLSNRTEAMKQKQLWFN